MSVVIDFSELPLSDENLPDNDSSSLRHCLRELYRRMGRAGNQEEDLPVPPPPINVINNPLIQTWKIVLAPWWKSISLFSSVSSLDSYCQIVANSGIRPTDAQKLNPLELASKTVLSVTDAHALRLGVNLAIQDKRKREGRINESLQLDDLSPPLEHRVSVETNDLDYVIRPLLEKNKEGTVDFAETVLCSAGPKDFISAERKVHALIVFPAAMLLGGILSEVGGRMSTTSSVGWENHITYTLGVSLSIVTFYFYSLTVVYGLIQIALCSFAALTDRSAAHYLTIPIFFRFADFVLVLISFVFLSPMATFLTAYGETPAGNGGAFFYVTLSVGIIYMILCITAVLFFGLRERRAYEPILSDTLKYHDEDKAIRCPRTPTTLTNVVKKFLFMENPKREIELLGFIGRWRKFNLSLRFRESILDSCATIPENKNHEGPEVWVPQPIPSP